MNALMPQLQLLQVTLPSGTTSNVDARDMCRLNPEVKALAPYFEEDFSWLLANAELLQRYKGLYVVIYRKNLLAAAKPQEGVLEKARNHPSYPGDFELVVAYINEHGAVAGFQLPRVWTVAEQLIHDDYEWGNREPEVQRGYPAGSIAALFRREVLAVGKDFTEALAKAQQHPRFPHEEDERRIVFVHITGCERQKHPMQL